jgi:glyoxylase-like metal-dependent hydrolase (beta-lactamase superfamily II)
MSAGMGATVRVDVRTSGIWQTNSVVLSAGGEALVVDPAFFPRELDELVALASARGSVRAVAFTHGHWDHVAGWRHFPKARMVGSEALARAVAQGEPVASRNLDQLREFDGRWYVPRPQPHAWPASIEPVADGARLSDLPGVEVVGLALAGHSADGLALWLPAEGLLLPGDHLSPCEIPFVEDLPAYRATLERLRGLLPRLVRVVPGHGPQLDRAQAEAILDADACYLDALAECALRGDRDAALALPLPRAADVPDMGDRHRENCTAAGFSLSG